MILSSQITSKIKERRILNFIKNDEKIKAARHLVQLYIWRGGLGILHMNTKLRTLKAKQELERLMNDPNAL